TLNAVTTEPVWLKRADKFKLFPPESLNLMFQLPEGSIGAPAPCDLLPPHAVKVMTTAVKAISSRVVPTRFIEHSLLGLSGRYFLQNLWTKAQRGVRRPSSVR